MNWKSWPYWVGGGIIGFIVAIPNSYIQGRKNCLNLSDAPYHLKCSEFSTAVFSGLSIAVTGIVIGSILGYLYGKFKNRRKMI